MKKIIFAILLSLFFSSFLEASCGSVVCIHGFLRTWHSMKAMGEAFRHQGYDAYLWDYPSRDHSICEHAQSLNKILKCIAQEKPGVPINFVTHSLGALILRTTLNLPDCPYEAKIGRAVLLAPPNKGSFVARGFRDNFLARAFFGAKSGYELMTYTETEMVSLGNFPACMEIMVVAGTRGVYPWFNRIPNDGKIAVCETYLNTPHFHCIVTLRHSSITCAPCILELAKKFIICKDPTAPCEECGCSCQK